MRDYKHLDRDFGTKHKVFIFQLDDSGGKIIITERNRFKNFVVDIDLGGGYWLSNVVGEVLRWGRNGQFKKLYMGNNY